MNRRPLAQTQRTHKLANAFLDECRRDLERAIGAGAELPPRLKSVHARAGHATPEYRTLAIPIPDGLKGASPDILSGLIARYAAQRPPICLLLALDALLEDVATTRRVLIAEARDNAGTRLFYLQHFRVEERRPVWEEPIGGGWRDPAGEEMVLDAAFAAPPRLEVPAPA